MTVVVTPEVRAAQRRIVSTINASGRLNKDGLAMWREADCGEWKDTAANIGRDLDLLEVPHTIVTAFRFPLAITTARPCAKARRSESYATYLAMLEIGRAQKGSFVCRYLRECALQREIEEA